VTYRRIIATIQNRFHLHHSLEIFQDS